MSKVFGTFFNRSLEISVSNYSVLPPDEPEPAPYRDKHVIKIALVALIADVISAFSWSPNISGKSLRGISRMKVTYDCKSPSVGTMYFPLSQSL